MAAPGVSPVVLDHVHVFVAIMRAGDLDSSKALTAADIACDAASQGGGRREVPAVEPGDAPGSAPVAVKWVGSV